MSYEQTNFTQIKSLIKHFFSYFYLYDPYETWGNELLYIIYIF